MATNSSLLIIDDNTDLVHLLTAGAELRKFRSVSAASLADTERALASGPFDAALVDIGLGSESGFDAIRLIKQHDPEIEIVVMSATTSLATAIQSFELAAFAFVQKPFEIEQLFATIDRALERRRMNLDNRRLVWELQTINEIAEGIARSLELQDVLAGALQHIVQALSGIGGSIRLRDDLTGAYETHAFLGNPGLPQMWLQPGLEGLRPSDRVIASRSAVILEDLRALVPPGSNPVLPALSALSVPMVAGEELLGTLTVGAGTPHRFAVADQRLLSIIAGQISVAVQNARLHDSIRRGKREWEQTFDAISDPIAVFDGRGELLRGNTALAAHLGRKVTGLRGTTCNDVGFCSGDHDCAVTRALANDGSHAEVTRPDGSIFSVTTFPVGGGVEGASVVQVAKNVTDEIQNARRLRLMSEEIALANSRSTEALERLKSTQAQLLQAEKLSAIGQLVAGVAHELNNPLTSVIGYAQLLEEELSDAPVAPEKQSQFASDLRRIAEESERAARIVRNLLAFARRQAAERTPQDVVELFGRVLSLRTYEHRLNNIELQVDFEPDLPMVIADGGQLQQALLNLVLNAEQAMRGRANRRLHVGARFDAAAAAVELFVADSGHGIENANLTKIFDPFFTTRDVGEGTGLGLSICYGIVRDHGGQIVVLSRSGVGTTFSLLLPARIEKILDAAPMLVAHMDQGEREFLSTVISAWGYQVVTAASTAEAIGHLHTKRLQAVFMDIGILAADLPAWRAARTPTAPVILMSMSADDGDVERFGREQASAVLTPPFQLRAVRSAVRAVSRECV